MAEGTFACPVCGKDTPHYHEPTNHWLVDEITQRIASHITGAGARSAFIDRWLLTSQGQGVKQMAAEIAAMKDAASD